MVAEKSVMENIGYRWIERRKEGQTEGLTKCAPHSSSKQGITSSFSYMSASTNLVNAVGKEEIACNKQFHLFNSVFFPFETLSSISIKFKIVSISIKFEIIVCKLFTLEEFKNLLFRWERVNFASECDTLG